MSIVTAQGNLLPVIGSQCLFRDSSVVVIGSNKGHSRACTWSFFVPFPLYAQRGMDIVRNPPLIPTARAIALDLSLGFKLAWLVRLTLADLPTYRVKPLERTLHMVVRPFRGGHCYRVSTNIRSNLVLSCTACIARTVQFNDKFQKV